MNVRNRPKSLLARALCGAIPATLAIATFAQPRTPSREEALDLLRRGEAQAARKMLEQVLPGMPTGRPADETRLLLGSVLVALRQDSDSIGPLEIVVRNGSVAPDHATILLARAVLAAKRADRYRFVEELLGRLAAGPAGTSPVVQEAATETLVRLLFATERFGDAAEAAETYLGSWPRGRAADDIRWLGAEALRKGGQVDKAFPQFEAIWYDSPGSPWANAARKASLDLLPGREARARVLDSASQYDFARSLQKAALHEPALAVLDSYLAQPSPAKADGALFLKAISLHATRKNDSCIRTFEELRTRFPASEHLPSAALVAMKAYMRGGRENEIRSLAEWLERTYPKSDKTAEVTYSLGVFLTAEGKEEEGMRLLERVAAGKSENADDSLWKLALTQRKVGRTDAAIGSLSRLLKEFPASGLRKAALYWFARHSAPTRPAEAKDAYQALLREFPNDYYGHLAVRRLKELGDSPRQIGSTQPFPAFDPLTSPSARPGSEPYALAVNLKKVGLFEFAVDELKRMREAGTDAGLQFALADLHSRAGNTPEAIQILESRFKTFLVSGSRNPAIVPRDFWYIAYPYNYRQVLESARVSSGLDEKGVTAWVLAAIIRAESRFYPLAVSPAGALGLMQLMPAEAEKLAKARTGTGLSRTELFTPETNILYGTRYLSDRIVEFEGDWVPAICSYNAGAKPVRGWWARKPPEMTLDEFLETIPYIDTRIYIKQILGDAQNYDWIYGKSY